MTSAMPFLSARAGGESRGQNAGPLDVRAIRSHFTFPEAGRIVTNNAASTQPPRELVDLYRSLAPGYENVHRGQSSASRRMTELFEESYDTIAQFIGAQVLRILLDLALAPDRTAYFGTSRPVGRAAVQTAMDRVSAWNKRLTGRALDGLSSIPALTVYGPRDAAQRGSLVAFNLAGRDPVSVAQGLNRAGVESRAGCHCATLAHHALRLNPHIRSSHHADVRIVPGLHRPGWPASRGR
jgi:selenocysteine lyase/cysteine desulfurase